MQIPCKCLGQMDLVPRRPLPTAADAKSLAVQELGPPKKVKTRRKRKIYLASYRRKLHKLSVMKLFELCMLSQLADKHFVCRSCGATEGKYSGWGRNIFQVRPL